MEAFSQTFQPVYYVLCTSTVVWLMSELQSGPDYQLNIAANTRGRWFVVLVSRVMLSPSCSSQGSGLAFKSLFAQMHKWFIWEYAPLKHDKDRPPNLISVWNDEKTWKMSPAESFPLGSPFICPPHSFTALVPAAGSCFKRKSSKNSLFTTCSGFSR